MIEKDYRSPKSSYRDYVDPARLLASPRVRRGPEDEIVDYFIELVKDGSLKPGQRLASQVNMAKQFNVHPGIMTKAMRKLVARGVIETKRGVGGGTWVAKDVKITLT